MSDSFQNGQNGQNGQQGQQQIPQPDPVKILIEALKIIGNNHPDDKFIQDVFHRTIRTVEAMPDWVNATQVAIQQRNRAEARASDNELNMTLSQNKIMELNQRVNNLVEEINELKNKIELSNVGDIVNGEKNHTRKAKLDS